VEACPFGICGHGTHSSLLAFDLIYSPGGEDGSTASGICSTYGISCMREFLIHRFDGDCPAKPELQASDGKLADHRVVLLGGLQREPRLQHDEAGLQDLREWRGGQGLHAVVSGSHGTLRDLGFAGLRRLGLDDRFRQRGRQARGSCVCRPDGRRDRRSGSHLLTDRW
jgi:hypothetical protein